MFLFIIAFLAFPNLSQADQSFVSAKRQVGESYLKAAERASSRKPRFSQSQNSLAQSQTAFDLRMDPKSVTPEKQALIPEWKNFEEVESFFKLSRDERYIQDPDFPSVLRRVSWMYPDDGCFARAGMVAAKAKERGWPLVGKIFAFGNLIAKTRNHPAGVVGWWYHVAAAVRVQNEVWVFDASIEPLRPLTWKQWMDRLNPEDSKATVSFCEGDTYNPYFSCDNADDPTAQATSNQLGFLPFERKRLLQMSRDVEAELGERPPWIISL